MVRLLGYIGHKVREILHLLQLKQSKLLFFEKENGKKKSETETPALFESESYFTGILTSYTPLGVWDGDHGFRLPGEFKGQM